jgi:DNA mismatch endonuclease, patch repair protein
LKRDIVSKTKRSEMMRQVARARTPGERAVASIVRELGIRYRLNRRTLPGAPDLSNRRQGWAIFVNGCFWHAHKNCPKTKAGPVPRVPVRNRRFWKKKLAGNRRRDARNIRELRKLGLKVIVIWECHLRDADKVKQRLRRALAPDDRR